MKATYRIADPDSVECTLSLTMTVDQWRSLLLKINEAAYPGWILGGAIRKLIANASREFRRNRRVSRMSLPPTPMSGGISVYLRRWDLVRGPGRTRSVIIEVDHGSGTITLSRRLDHAIIGWCVRIFRRLRPA